MVAASNGKKRNDVPDEETDAQVASNIASIMARLAESQKEPKEPKRRKISQERKFKKFGLEDEKATQAAVVSNIASIWEKVAAPKNGDSEDTVMRTGTPEARIPTVTRIDLGAESTVPAKPLGDYSKDRSPSVMILEEPLVPVGEKIPEVVILQDDDDEVFHHLLVEPDVEEYQATDRDLILDRDTVADTTRVPPVIKAKDPHPSDLERDTVANSKPDGMEPEPVKSHIADIMKKATELLVSHLPDESDESTVVQEVSTLLTNLLGNRVETWKEILIGSTVPVTTPTSSSNESRAGPRFSDRQTVAAPEAMEPTTVTRKRVSKPELSPEPQPKRGRVESSESQELDDLMAKINEDIEVIGCLIKGKWQGEASCPACRQQFNSKSKLGSHIRKTHNDRESLKNPEILKWFGMATMCD